MADDVRKQRMTNPISAAHLQHILERVTAFYPTNEVHVHFDEEGVMSLTVEADNERRDH